MKKKITLFIYLFISITADADVWTQKANFPSTINRSGQVGFSIGSKGYVGGGYEIVTGNYLSDFWEYNPNTNLWTQKASFPLAMRGAIGFSINGKGYVGIGSNTQYFWEYDPILDSWTAKATFGGAGREFATSFVINNKGYVGTGWRPLFTDFFLRDFWVWDPATNIWTEIDSMPGEKREGAVGFAINGKGYVSCGEENFSNTFLSDTWEYDPTTNSWTQKADFNNTGRVSATGFSLCDKGYFGTGGDATNVNNDFWQYDPLLNLWIQKSNFTNIKRSGCSSFTINNKVFFGLGNNVNGNFLNDFWEYTPDSICTTELIEIPNIKNSVGIFPSPSNVSFTVKINNNANGVFRFSLTDLTGRLINEQDNLVNGDNQFDHSELSAGLYLWQVYSGNTIIGKGKVSIVKQN